MVFCSKCKSKGKGWIGSDEAKRWLEKSKSKSKSKKKKESADSDEESDQDV